MRALVFFTCRLAPTYFLEDVHEGAWCFSAHVNDSLPNIQNGRILADNGCGKLRELYLH